MLNGAPNTLKLLSELKQCEMLLGYRLVPNTPRDHVWWPFLTYATLAMFIIQSLNILKADRGSSPWWWRHCAPVKRMHTSTRLQAQNPRRLSSTKLKVSCVLPHAQWLAQRTQTEQFLTPTLEEDGPMECCSSEAERFHISGRSWQGRAVTWPPRSPDLTPLDCFV
jgi:hypothetical protein